MGRSKICKRIICMFLWLMRAAARSKDAIMTASDNFFPVGGIWAVDMRFFDQRGVAAMRVAKPSRP
jgi:hypothetical protein